MTDNSKKLLELASQNEELRKALNEATDMEKVISIAREYGISLTEDDLKAPDYEGDKKLSSEELDSVVGGKKCFCIVGGGGEVSRDRQGVCGCVVYGVGNDIYGGFRCECPLGGMGSDI